MPPVNHRPVHLEHSGIVELAAVGVKWPRVLPLCNQSGEGRGIEGSVTEFDTATCKPTPSRPERSRRVSHSSRPLAASALPPASDRVTAGPPSAYGSRLTASANLQSTICNLKCLWPQAVSRQPLALHLRTLTTRDRGSVSSLSSETSREESVREGFCPLGPPAALRRRTSRSRAGQTYAQAEVLRMLAAPR